LFTAHEVNRNWSPQTVFLNTHECSQRTKWLITTRPSFDAANQDVTLTRVTNERVV